MVADCHTISATSTTGEPMNRLSDAAVSAPARQRQRRPDHEPFVCRDLAMCRDSATTG
jgi:hypothetical protein